MKNVFKVSLLAAAVAVTFTVGYMNHKEAVKLKTEAIELKVYAEAIKAEAIELKVYAEAIKAEAIELKANAEKLKADAVRIKAEAVRISGEATAVSLENKQEKVAYAVGQSFSGQFNAMLAKQEELGMTLDKEVVLQGITDTLRDTAKLSEEDMMATLQAYGEKMKAVAEKLQLEKAEKASAEAKVFLDANAKVEGVTVTESGLQYSVITKAEGPKPKAEDTVTVHYVGTLVDGTEFDSSVKRGQPATFPLNRVIPGWTEGVQLMSVGEKYKFVIPAEIGYGDQGAGTIPPGATLIFEVELLEIKAPDAAAKK